MLIKVYPFNRPQYRPTLLRDCKNLFALVLFQPVPANENAYRYYKNVRYVTANSTAANGRFDWKIFMLMRKRRRFSREIMAKFLLLHGARTFAPAIVSGEYSVGSLLL